MPLTRRNGKKKRPGPDTEEPDKRETYKRNPALRIQPEIPRIREKKIFALEKLF